MKKIGILLNSTNCSKYLIEIVSELAKSDQIELYFLLNNSVTDQQGIWQAIKSTLKTKGLLRFIDLVFFKFLTYAEHKSLSIIFPRIKEHNKTMGIDGFTQNDIIYLNPIFSSSGLIVRYPDKDIEKIKSLNLDLIIRGTAPGIFKGGILKAAKNGIISFHHGDNRWNRGGPPAFWEVFLRKSSTGFILQVLTEELDGGSVIFRGDVPTLRSYTENLVHLYNESYPYLAKIILEYANSDHLPSKEESIPSGEPLLMVPSFGQSISYLLRTAFLYTSLIVNRIALRKREKWGVAFVADSWRNAILRKGIQIKNPPNRFFADPFVVTKDGRTVCYVEDYCYKKKKGCITAIEIINHISYHVLGAVIVESFHMSFPYLFEYQNELYMVPETEESNSIRLYKCVEFPSKWQYQKDILIGVSAVDPMIFKYKGRWWLLINISSSNGFSKKLVAYYSSHPLSNEWIAHERNPLIVNNNIERNGGLLDIEGKLPIRVRQKFDFHLYGSSLSLARITDLTPSSFSEQEIGQILPNFFPNIKGCHHIHSNGKYTVYDYVHFETLK